MSSEITDKTHVLVASGLGRFYITERQATLIKQVLISGTAKAIEVGDSVISTHAIQGIVHGNQILELDKSRKGDWKCKFGFWHERNQSCAHAELAHLR